METKVTEASEVVDNVEVMLTTFDNPFDPFDEFVPWFLFDESKGYSTCSKIARIARSSDELSTIEDKRETERAIDVIIDNDFLNIYKKVTRNSNEEQESAQSSTAEIAEDDEKSVTEQTKA